MALLFIARSPPPRPNKFKNIAAQHEGIYPRMSLYSAGGASPAVSRSFFIHPNRSNTSMKASLIALITCCAVSSAAFASQNPLSSRAAPPDDPGTNVPKIGALDDPGTNVPKWSALDDPGTNVPKIGALDDPGTNVPKLGALDDPGTNVPKIALPDDPGTNVPKTAIVGRSGVNSARTS
jgi:hypothetical protein